MSLLSYANRISLNGRLIGGFGLLMVLSAGTSVFYNLRIRDVRDNVAHIERASLATDTVSNFTRELLLLRRVIVDYVRSGTAADRAKSLAAFEPLDKSIDRVREIVGPRGDVMRTGLSDYHGAFSRLDEEIKKRQGALQTINASGIRLTNSLTTVTLDLGPRAKRRFRPPNGSNRRSRRFAPSPIAMPERHPRVTWISSPRNGKGSPRNWPRRRRCLRPILRSPRSSLRYRRRSRKCWPTRISWSGRPPRRSRLCGLGQSRVKLGDDAEALAQRISDQPQRAPFRPPRKLPRMPRRPARLLR